RHPVCRLEWNRLRRRPALVRRTSQAVSRAHDSSHGWCSLRLRCDRRELELLKSAGRVRGAALARTPRTDARRTALRVARARRQVGERAAQLGSLRLTNLANGGYRLSGSV